MHDFSIIPWFSKPLKAINFFTSETETGTLETSHLFEEFCSCYLFIYFNGKYKQNRNSGMRVDQV